MASQFFGVVDSMAEPPITGVMVTTAFLSLAVRNLGLVAWLNIVLYSLAAAAFARKHWQDLRMPNPISRPASVLLVSMVAAAVWNQSAEWIPGEICLYLMLMAFASPPGASRSQNRGTPILPRWQHDDRRFELQHQGTDYREPVLIPIGENFLIPDRLATPWGFHDDQDTVAIAIPARPEDFEHPMAYILTDMRDFEVSGMRDSPLFRAFENSSSRSSDIDLEERGPPAIVAYGDVPSTIVAFQQWWSAHLVGDSTRSLSHSSSGVSSRDFEVANARAEEEPQTGEAREQSPNFAPSTSGSRSISA